MIRNVHCNDIFLREENFKWQLGFILWKVHFLQTAESTDFLRHHALHGLLNIYLAATKCCYLQVNSMKACMQYQTTKPDQTLAECYTPTVS